METTQSADGTTIAFTSVGAGPAIVLALGAFNDSASGAPLAAALADEYTVISYDRRGRGASGDTQPYAVEREVEDLAAVVEAADGSAAVFGHSSGALLALRAAASGVPITHLALYEPPLNLDPGWPARARELTGAIKKLLAEGKRGDAVELFQTDVIGMPVEVVEQLRQAPFRPGLEAMAHTLVYELVITGEPDWQGEAAQTAVPALLIVGGDSPPFMHRAAEALRGALPNGDEAVLPGQTHHIDPVVTASALKTFFGG